MPEGERIQIRPSRKAGFGERGVDLFERPPCALEHDAGVSSTRRVVRMNSTSPSSRIARESGDCDMCNRSAARPKCNSSATATK